MVWRCRNSAAANRRALHSDYTSATEKTPTPLNGRRTQPQNPSWIAATRQRRCMRCTTAAPTSAHACAKFPLYQKPLWNRRFCASSAIVRCCAPAIKFARFCRRRVRKVWRCVGFTQVKIFFHSSPCGGVTRWSFRSKTSESSTQVIRVVRSTHLRRHGRAKRLGCGALKTAHPAPRQDGAACSTSKSELVLENLVH